MQQSADRKLDVMVKFRNYHKNLLNARVITFQLKQTFLLKKIIETVKRLRAVIELLSNIQMKLVTGVYCTMTMTFLQHFATLFFFFKYINNILQIYPQKIKRGVSIIICLRILEKLFVFRKKFLKELLILKHYLSKTQFLF